MNKILIIDDQFETSVILSKWLQKENFEIIFAKSGKEGLEKIKSDKPDIVLLDVMMPDINGFELCSIIKSDPNIEATPVVLVTARTSSEDLEHGFNVGAIDYIKKPVDRLELITRIKSVLKLQRAHRMVVEAEKMSTFAATVVTANHKIKQPLTLINLSVSALKRELSKEDISKEAILKRIDYITGAVEEINNILNILNTTENLKLADYVRDIKMLDIDSSSQNDEQAS